MDSTPTSAAASGDAESINPTELAAEVILDITPFFRVYKDGHADRMTGEDFFPPTIDSTNSVSSRDISIDSKTGLSARLFLPTHLLSTTTTTSAAAAKKKLPLLIYFHGGGFIIGTPFSETYHRCVRTLVEKSNVVAVSVHYRRAPENPIPAAYEDARDAIRWAASHRDGSGPDPWLNLHADFNRLYLAGDSAGANIAHNMAMEVGCGGILGVALVHPFFWGSDPIGSEGSNPAKVFIDKFWPAVCPSSFHGDDGPGNDDPRLNPLSSQARRSLELLGCRRVLVCVAEKDALKDRGWAYYEALRKSGWMGDVEIHQTQAEQHVFHLDNPECENANRLVDLLAYFFNKALPPSSPL